MPLFSYPHLLTYTRRALLLVLLGVSQLLWGRTELPAGGQLVASLEAGQNIGFYTGTFDGKPVGNYEEVLVDHPDFDVALRVTVSNPSGNFWTGGGRIGIDTSASKGDVGLVRMYIRTIKTLSETGDAVGVVFVQGPNNEKSVIRSITSNKEWSEFLIPFEFLNDYDLGDVTLQFGMGTGRHAQTYELAGFEVYYYGTSLSVDDLPETAVSYAGRELDADWRVAAAERIETHRKTDFTVRLEDADGMAVPFVGIQTNMTRHSFEFGAAFSTLAMIEETAEGDMLREKTVELFNSGGPFNHLKWKALAGDFGPAWTEEKLLQALAWAKGQGLKLRGHVLVWPAESHLPKIVGDLIPDDNPSAADESIKDLALAHIDRATQLAKDYVTEWDVLNEPYDNHQLMDAFGDEVMLDWFNRARQNLPDTGLFLNDYNILSTNTSHQNHFEDTVRYLKENGAPITGMGFQGHYGSSPTGIPDIEIALQRYVNAFPDLDVRVTEFTVDSKDEEMQADFLRDFYTLLFSYPQVLGIQQWGFKVGNEGEYKGMYDFDWREKPAAVAYKQLVFDDWWSSFSGRTTREGYFRERGFFGEYEAVVVIDGVEYKLPFELVPGQGEVVLNLPISLSDATADYQSWADATFTAEQLADQAVSGPDGDADGDGLSNIFEYTFQLKDGVVESGPFQVVDFNADEITLRHYWPHGATALTLVMELSDNLSSWQRVSGADSVTSLSDYLVVETKIQKSSQENAPQFLRFRVLKSD